MLARESIKNEIVRNIFNFWTRYTNDLARASLQFVWWTVEKKLNHLESAFFICNVYCLWSFQIRITNLGWIMTNWTIQQNYLHDKLLVVDNSYRSLTLVIIISVWIHSMNHRIIIAYHFKALFFHWITVNQMI